MRLSQIQNPTYDFLRYFAHEDILDREGIEYLMRLRARYPSIILWPEALVVAPRVDGLRQVYATEINQDCSPVEMQSRVIRYRSVWFAVDGAYRHARSTSMLADQIPAIYFNEVDGDENEWYMISDWVYHVLNGDKIMFTDKVDFDAYCAQFALERASEHWDVFEPYF